MKLEGKGGKSEDVLKEGVFCFLAGTGPSHLITNRERGQRESYGLGRVGLTNGKAFMFRISDIRGQKGLLTDTVFHHEKTLAEKWSNVNDTKSLEQNVWKSTKFASHKVTTRQIR